MFARTALVLSSLALVLAGCHGNRMGSAPTAITAASDQQRGMLLDQVKKLAGTWEMVDEKGKKTVASVFTVGSGGTAVREIMFPGSDHEMTNMYHMDGDSLIMTHYCAVGNQPRMRASSGSAGKIVFTFDSVTNFCKTDDHCMGEMTLVITDNDHMEQQWRGLKDGRFGSDHDPVFKFTRKK